MDDDNHVVIGMDPHKRSVTIEVMAADEQGLGAGRFATDVEGFTAMLAYVAAWPNRVWAIEGCEGIGRHVAQRLLAQGESVVDVPAKLSARVRVFVTGQSRKTDDTDARSIALVGVRMAGLRAVVDDAQLVPVVRRGEGAARAPRWQASALPVRRCQRVVRVPLDRGVGLMTLGLGEHGDVFYATENGRTVAMVYYRDYSGLRRRLRANGRSKKRDGA